MSHENLANAFREAILDFTWRQWGQLGVSAGVNQPDHWCQDPEALLLFTLEVARREPRMFDEVIDWLAVVGPELMRQRLVNLLRADPAADVALVSAALASAGERALSPTGLMSKIPEGPGRPVFYNPYEGLADVPVLDAIFQRHGLRRPPFARSHKSRSPEIHEAIALTFRLRAIFGSTTRAEAVRCLLLRPDREHGTAEVATLAGLSRVGVHEALAGLALAGVCEASQRGRKDLIWWLDGPRWQAWLGLAPEDTPTWVDWVSVYRGLLLLWRWLHAPERQGESPYIRASRAREVMDAAGPLLVNRGLAWKRTPSERYRGEAYWEAFERDVETLARLLAPV
jgi:hypothetical protein